PGNFPGVFHKTSKQKKSGKFGHRGFLEKFCIKSLQSLHLVPGVYEKGDIIAASSVRDHTDGYMVQDLKESICTLIVNYSLPYHTDYTVVLVDAYLPETFKFLQDKLEITDIVNG